jgi:2-dehydropantoate 2-reductase
MKDIKKVSLIGLGGIGASFGAKLHQYDSSILRVIAEKERAERYKRAGVIINGEKIDFNYFTPEDKIEKADLLIISTKYDGLKDAIELSHNQVDDSTIIISLLNGISSEDIVKDYYPKNKVLYSVCVGQDIVRKDREITYSNLGYITFGDNNNETLSEETASVKDLFEKSNIPYEIPVDMGRAMWWKFMVNVGVNQASAVMGFPYRVFKNSQEARDVVRALMNEVVQISVKKGVNLTSADIDLFLYNTLPTLGDSGKTSMLQDIEAGRKTEVEMFSKSVIDLGIKYNVPTPINQVFYDMIITKEKYKLLL